MHIGDNAHGAGEVELFAKLSQNGYVKVVGHQNYQGLDSFARVVTHECTHKRMYEAMRENLNPPELPVVTPPRDRVDLDGDGVPDEWENAVGLNTDSLDTIGGWNEAFDPDNEAPPDNEIFGRMCERDLFVNMNNDWADDGLNWNGLATHLRHLRCNRSGPPKTEEIDEEYKNQTLIWPDARGVASAPYTGGAG